MASGFHDQLLCLMLKEGGFRIGELLCLHIKDLDFGQEEVYVRFRPGNENQTRAKSDTAENALFIFLPR
ncbi:hypothetical protein KSX_94560 [Ktedonospora formicarum]|uniref:Tyr recombinase domain-containing protein n=1 Tax=Ktedonospora formicarum TaxID=2778364 RepID=A0A8J3IC71_9CHLR|nr:hypothetical protein KSX_94560 [Ktedonospora formicarum]